ncbi:hypothetical protein Tco_1471333 [Tanacetum coccineum]
MEDGYVFPAREQPLPPVDSPTAESLGYIIESDPEEDPEEYEDDETEDGPVDYLMDEGDDRDDDDGNSSGNDINDEDEEEEEHLALADSAIVEPTDEPVSPPKGTEPVIPPPSTDITTTGARITVRPQAPISLPPEAEVERLLAMPTPSPSPPISLSAPSARDRLARYTTLPILSSPPPVLSPLLPSSGCPTRIQTLRIASTQALIDAVTAALPSPPLPPLPPSLYIPLPVDHMDDIPESEDTWVDPAEAVHEIAPMTVGEDSRSRISQRVDMDSQRVDLLMGDSMTLLETELQTHRDHVYAHETHLQAHQTQLQLQGTLIQTQHQVHETRFQMQQAEIAALRETDRRRQAQMVETLRVMRDIRRIMAPATRRGQNTTPNNTNPNNMTPESIQAMIDQTLL